MTDLEFFGGDIEDAIGRVRVPAYVINHQGIIRWLNPAARKLVGDVRGRPGHLRRCARGSPPGAGDLHPEPHRAAVGLRQQRRRHRRRRRADHRRGQRRSADERRPRDRRLRSGQGHRGRRPASTAPPEPDAPPGRGAAPPSSSAARPTRSRMSYTSAEIRCGTTSGVCCGRSMPTPASKRWRSGGVNTSLRTDTQTAPRGRGGLANAVALPPHPGR